MVNVSSVINLKFYLMLIELKFNYLVPNSIKCYLIIGNYRFIIEMSLVKNNDGGLMRLDSSLICIFNQNNAY